MPVAATEGRNEIIKVIPSLHCQRCHLQASNPAFGTGCERVEMFFREIDLHHLAKKSSTFIKVESQIRGAQFVDLPARS
jgi:hypothetical protein